RVARSILKARALGLPSALARLSREDPRVPSIRIDPDRDAATMRALIIGGGIALASFQPWRFIVARSRASSTRHTRHGQKIWADTGGPTGAGVSVVTGNRRTTP